MFSDEMLTKIYSKTETENIPVGYLTTVTHVIEDVLEEMGYDFQFQQTRNTNTRNPYE